MDHIRHYYVTGHTRVGFFSVLPELMKQMDIMFVIKDLSRKQTSELLETLAKLFQNLGHRIDYFQSPSDNEKIEGIRILDKNVMIVANEVIEKINADFSEQRVVFFPFQSAFDKEKQQINENRKIQLERERDYHFQEAYRHFGEATAFHEQKEKIFLSAMDFKKADEVASRLVKTIFNNDQKEDSKQGNVERLFFGAATPKGAVNTIESLTSKMKRRFIIKGRSGSGKSTLIRKVGNEALRRGYNITYFLCGFDPSSIDMLIIEKLDVAILDGTEPHVIDPSRENDEVIDMFVLTMDQNVDIEKKDEIALHHTNYKERMKKGTQHLLKAKEAQDVIDEYIEASFDQEKLHTLMQETIDRIIERTK